jgi:polyhydroxybutyrate depolymerase
MQPGRSLRVRTTLMSLAARRQVPNKLVRPLALYAGLVLAIATSAYSVGGQPATYRPLLTSDAKPPGPASVASGCGHAVTAGATTLHLEVGGPQRAVIVYLPAEYKESTPMALVLNMHGSGSTPKQEELFSGMDATANADGFIVAYPQGLIPSGSGFDWNVPGEPLFGGGYPPKNAADDVTFLSGLVPDLAARYCIDLKRVYATGVSGGGRMASQLACDASGTFAAVAPVAGLRFPGPCPATRPVPVIAFHGTADPIDPYNGHGQAYWTYSVPTAAQRWAAHDGCRTSPQDTSGAGYRLTDYTNCRGGASVELYSIAGEGHEWPGGPKVPALITKLLGPHSDAVDADSAMWAFFDAHPMP